MKILEIENLSKSYESKLEVVSDCSFSIESGNICAIVGESGSGKSTLFRLIAGLERPEKGSIKVKEKIVSNDKFIVCLLYTSPSPRDSDSSRMPSSA